MAAFAMELPPAGKQGLGVAPAVAEASGAGQVAAGEASTASPQNSWGRPGQGGRDQRVSGLGSPPCAAPAALSTWPVTVSHGRAGSPVSRLLALPVGELLLRGGPGAGPARAAGSQR